MKDVSINPQIPDRQISIEWIKANAAFVGSRIVKLERENADLRAKLARLDGLTNWVCSCGGTDCKGQEENAALEKLIIEAGYIITNFNGQMALCRDPWHQPKQVNP